MSRVEPQAPAPGGKGAPIYTREDLIKEIKRVEGKMSYILDNWSEASRLLYKIWRYLSYATNTEKTSELYDRIRDVETLIYDIIDEMIVRELRLDTDVEKYTKPSYENERTLGVALVRDGGETKPVVVVVYTDYKRIDYYEVGTHE
jgi:hypothetical protein